MESFFTMGTIGFFASSRICSSVTNNAFSIERSHIVLVSRKFVKTLFFWLLMITIVVHVLETKNLRTVSRSNM